MAGVAQGFIASLKRSASGRFDFRRHLTEVYRCAIIVSGFTRFAPHTYCPHTLRPLLCPPDFAPLHFALPYFTPLHFNCTPHFSPPYFAPQHFAIGLQINSVTKLPRSIPINIGLYIHVQ